MSRSTRIEKIMYIVEHPELLNLSQVPLANALKAAGLVSQKTSPVDLGPKRLQEAAREFIARGVDMDEVKRRMITYDKAKAQSEVAKLKKLGYPDNLIEIVAINGVMCARPLGSGPKLEDRIRDMFPTQKSK